MRLTRRAYRPAEGARSVTRPASVVRPCAKRLSPRISRTIAPATGGPPAPSRTTTAAVWAASRAVISPRGRTSPHHRITIEIDLDGTRG
jgi:hypothetical protein